MPKKSSQEEIDMRSTTEAEEKGVYLEDTSKGKSSPVTIVERSDTLHEIVGNQNATITPQMQDHRTPDRGILTKTTTMPLEA
jgi:hypothetical protein